MILEIYQTYQQLGIIQIKNQTNLTIIVIVQNLLSKSMCHMSHYAGQAVTPALRNELDLKNYYLPSLE